MKTIDISVKEWFDKVNGNSYFAGCVTIDYCLPSEMNLTMPFQYGYGDHYIDVAKRLLIDQHLINCADYTALWQYCQDNKIILRTFKQKNCKKRDLLAIN